MNEQIDPEVDAWSSTSALSWLKKKCPECDEELDEDGEGEICCFYSCSECPTCKGRTCDQSC